MTETKVKKNKGPIRYEAIITIAIILLLIGGYTHFFFDSHLRRAIEWGGYQAVGAEVNIGSLKTSFTKASIHIQKLQMTDATQPSRNSIEIGEIRFSALWDALLRAKLVVNEMAVENIAFNTPRKSPGRVKPPEPVDNSPGFLATEGAKLADKATDKLAEKGEENVLGDVVALLQGGSAEGQLEQLKQQLLSEQKLAAFEKDLKDKEQAWKARLASLPQSKELEAIGAKANQIKTKDFRSVDELQQSLKQADTLIKEVDAQIKIIDQARKDLGSDFQLTEQGLKDLEAQIKADIKELESHFRLPQLDAKAMSRALLSGYLQPYLGKVQQYQGMAKKYLPPNLGKKAADPEDISLQPRPRAKGVTYEFGRPNSYPLVWVKRVGISSKAGTSPQSGDVAGEILDITSNQKLINKATVLNIKADFPSEKIYNLSAVVSLDGRPEPTLVKYNFAVGSYPLADKMLVEQKDVSLGFTNASAQLEVTGELVGLQALELSLKNTVTQAQFAASSSQPLANEILSGVFKDLRDVTIQARMWGDLPKVNLALQSNLGELLVAGFSKQLQAKIDETRAKIQAYVNEQVGKKKAELEAEFNETKAQVEGEIKKIQAQIDQQKKATESKIQAAKKSEEDKAKGKIEEEGKKALDKLKKGLGW